jgi:hypothetical protein
MILKVHVVNIFCSARKAATSFNTNYQLIMRYVRDRKINKEQWFLSTSLIYLDIKKVNLEISLINRRDLFGTTNVIF